MTLGELFSKMDKKTSIDRSNEMQSVKGETAENKNERRGSPQKRKRHFSSTKPFPKNKKFAQGSDEKPDWIKIKQEKKELRQKRKQAAESTNETYRLGVQVKKIWEELRRDDCKGDRKIELCNILYKLIRGKVKSLIYAHDTVRVIETLVSSGSDELKAQLFLEMKDDLLDLCKNKYSKFFVIKFLRFGTKEQKNMIIQAMIGNVVNLMRHKIACDVLEIAYNEHANAKQRAEMIQEFYGPQFRLFKENVNTLGDAIEKFPDAKEKILTDVFQNLQPILEKGVFTNIIIHTLLKEYLYICGEAEKESIIESIREGLLPIIHTRDGARVGMLCFWNCTPKEKKAILKSFKQHFIEIALEEYGHMVLLAVFDSVDDTVFVSKVVLSELMANLDQVITNEYGKKVLKYLVAPRSKLYFHPGVLSVLEEGDKISRAKKEKSIKYTELQKAVADPILKLIERNINEWAKDSHWTLFIGSALQSLYSDSVVPIFVALADMCSEPHLPDAEKHFLDEAYIYKMICFIIQCDKDRFKENKPYFSSYLIESAGTEMKGWVLTNRGCFLLVRLIETEIPDVVDSVNKICHSLKYKLKTLKFPGAEIFLKKLRE